MNCPHCNKEIKDLGETLWRIWYREDVCHRVFLYTHNESLKEVVAPAVDFAIKSVEAFAGAVATAYNRGVQEGLGNPHGNPPPTPAAGEPPKPG